jgi:transcriptional regulator with XRE-family HTH domain
MTESQPGDVGDRIRRYRDERGVSLNHLAQEAGVSKSYLWSLENEPSAARPSAQTLYAIAKALGVTMSDLLGRQLLTDAPDEIPDSLKEFAEAEGLPESDVRMLASIRFRGEQPITTKRWSYIYEAIRTSRMLDQEAADERPRRDGSRKHAADAEGLKAVNERHVMRDARGGWVVNKGSGDRMSSRHATQAEAIDRAREILQNTGGGELVIHGEDGRVRHSDTVSAGTDANSKTAQ